MLQPVDDLFTCYTQGSMWKMQQECMAFVFFQERMDFIENMLGDSVQKHSEALP